MMAIFLFLLLGATSTLVLLQRKWAPKVNDVLQACAERERGLKI
jgi:MFS transporter, ACS family, D-galactonate transporter